MAGNQKRCHAAQSEAGGQAYRGLYLLAYLFGWVHKQGRRFRLPSWRTGSNACCYLCRPFGLYAIGKVGGNGAQARMPVATAGRFAETGSRGSDTGASVSSVDSVPSVDSADSELSE